MMIGSVDNPSGFIEYPPAIRRALDFLHSNDFTKMEDGKYSVEDDIIFAKVQRYETIPIADCIPEAHRKFVDIQYMADGEEYLGWCPINPDLRERVPYDEKEDIVFYEKLIPESNFVMAAGNFAIISPKDVHQPRGAIDDKPIPVTKVVIKIATALLDANG